LRLRGKIFLSAFCFPNFSFTHPPVPPSFLKLFKFLAIGIPAFLVAIPINYLLVEKLLWPKPAAYALVLVIQVTINFFACIYFVFQRDESTSLRSQFVLFMSGILSARVMDWGAYSLLTWLGMNYMLAQFLNVAIFSIAKFSFARRTIEGKP
jgi:putative flippase GtrA